MTFRLLRLALLLGLAAGVAGCDKCGDYFWVNTGAPHSCKSGPDPH